MTSQQQRKARARARHDAYVDRQHTKATRRRRRNVVLASVVGTVIVVAGVVFLQTQVGDDSDAPAASDSPSSDASPGASQDASQDEFTYKAAAPTLAKGAPADLRLDTDHGPITITLDTTKAPQNSNSLAFLASKGYFDDTTCHRLTTEGIFVLQCGDRTGSGSGGPGYTTPDENLPKEGKNNYPKGTVAMAEPQGGEAGSQFFLVYEDTTLPPDYTIVGQVTSGLDVVEEIAKAGVAPGSSSPGDGAPAEPITITAATVKQSK